MLTSVARSQPSAPWEKEHRRFLMDISFPVAAFLLLAALRHGEHGFADYSALRHFGVGPLKIS